MPKLPFNKETSLLSKQASLDFLLSAGTDLLSGKLPIEAFKKLFLAELKSEYIRQYIFGFGGRENMTSKDWGSIGGNLSQQYKYANRFIEDIDLDNLSDDGILNRLKLYSESSDEIFEIANERKHEQDGYTQEIWILDDAKEHCQDCLEYADMGWVPLGTLPVPCDGSTECMNNCGCYKEYGFGDEEQSKYRIGTENSGNYNHAGRPGEIELRSTKKELIESLITYFVKRIGTETSGNYETNFDKGIPFMKGISRKLGRDGKNTN